MKGIATDKLHKIQRYQEAILSVQKHLGPSHAFIHQSVHTNPTKSGGGQVRHKTLWAVFLAAHNTRAQQKTLKGRKSTNTSYAIFCAYSQPVPQMTHLPETEVTELEHGTGVMQASFASQPNHSMQLHPFISGGYTAQTMASSCTGGSELVQNALLSNGKTHLALPWILPFESVFRCDTITTLSACLDRVPPPPLNVQEKFLLKEVIQSFLESF